MNQPKFKFGDCVIDKETRKKFNVFAIASSGSGFYSYRDEYYKSLFIHESDLELYQEPQKKKLYAYKSIQGLVGFSESEIHGPQINGYGTQRVPDYDIEYPGAK